MQALIEQARNRFRKKDVKHYSFLALYNELGYTTDANYAKRWLLIQRIYANYSKADRQLIGYLLKQELKAYRAGSALADSVYLCAFMLYDTMKEKDSLLLYQAKLSGNTDLQCCVDTEILFGKKPKATLNFLKRKKRQGRKIAKQALKAIKYYRSYKDAIYQEPKAFSRFFKERRGPNLIETMQACFNQDELNNG
ncbi:hypothetical protein VQ643_08620 [Pseudomonas sp. F1_0610]|uniref:hypothetical protein n=1 Tax=Pseudomonas sp. F1_0610 TaxID=3114284 RepID=UPI0039C0E3D4